MSILFGMRRAREISMSMSTSKYQAPATASIQHLLTACRGFAFSYAYDPANVKYMHHNNTTAAGNGSNSSSRKASRANSRSSHHRDSGGGGKQPAGSSNWSNSNGKYATPNDHRVSQRLNNHNYTGRGSKQIGSGFSSSSSSESTLSLVNMAQVIQWYPGHIAKAERELSEYLKKVDVVIEVRDARIPQSTTHPLVSKWVGKKPLIVAISRLDQVTPQALNEWNNYFLQYGNGRSHSHSSDSVGNDEVGHSLSSTTNTTPPVFYINGKNGSGVSDLKAHALSLSCSVNEKRLKHGITPRAIRVAIIGYPNVGKSALINRLLGRKKALSKNMPGVTRQMQWIAIGGKDKSRSTDSKFKSNAKSRNTASHNSNNVNNVATASYTTLLELLDSPGIIPAKQVDQSIAIKLAICNDIGEASYDKILIAEALCDILIYMYNTYGTSYIQMNKIEERYDILFRTMNSDSILPAISDKYFNGNITAAAERLLSDFRKGHLGKCSLEAPLLACSHSSYSDSNTKKSTIVALQMSKENAKIHPFKKLSDIGWGATDTDTNKKEEKEEEEDEEDEEDEEEEEKHYSFDRNTTNMTSNSATAAITSNHPKANFPKTARVNEIDRSGPRHFSFRSHALQGQGKYDGQ